MEDPSHMRKFLKPLHGGTRLFMNPVTMRTE